MTIYFDMDGTLGDFYSVEGWLSCLENHDPRPYAEAAPIGDFRQLARLLNKLQEDGYEIGIVSWLSRSGTEEFNEAVRKAKRRWLAKHLPSVDWDEIHMVKYGTPKQYTVKDKNGILFDDEEKNREKWTGQAFTPEEIFSVLKSLL